MARLAVLYDSSEGQTAKIAERIGRHASELGHVVRVANVRKLPGNFPLDGFDGVLLGASIHVGRHSRRAVDFVKRHRAMLNSVPSSFFSVSLSAAGKTPQHREQAERCIAEFLQRTGWKPMMTASIAGALRYREYGFLKRFIMRRIAAKEGGDTDLTRDWEYTDWEQVTRFVEAFVHSVRPDGAPRHSA